MKSSPSLASQVRCSSTFAAHYRPITHPAYNAHRLPHHFLLRIRGARRKEPEPRDGADPAARHPAVGANPRLSHLHRRILPKSVSWPRVWRRARLRVRDLHQPGLEHDFQHVSVDPQRAEGSRGSLPKLSSERLAPLLPPPFPVRPPSPDLHP